MHVRTVTTAVGQAQDVRGRSLGLGRFRRRRHVTTVTITVAASSQPSRSNSSRFTCRGRSASSAINCPAPARPCRCNASTRARDTVPSAASTPANAPAANTNTTASTSKPAELPITPAASGCRLGPVRVLQAHRPEELRVRLALRRLALGLRRRGAEVAQDAVLQREHLPLLGGLGVVVALVALVLATLTTNLAANVVAPANGFSNLSPRRISFKAGGYITAGLGIAIFPWKLLESTGSYIFTWLIGYSALLGPIAGIMLADYLLLRRTELDAKALFDHRGIYGPGSNVVECAADVLRLLGHNMPPAGEDLDEAAE